MGAGVTAPYVGSVNLTLWFCETYGYSAPFGRPASLCGPIQMGYDAPSPAARRGLDLGGIRVNNKTLGRHPPRP